MSRPKDIIDINLQTVVIEAYKTKSPAVIGKELNIAVSKVMRILKDCGVSIRSRAESQKLALQSGRKEHPTAGKERPKELKAKIGATVSRKYRDLTEEEKLKRKEEKRIQFANRTTEFKERFWNEGHRTARETTKYGSRLEQFLSIELRKAGYEVDFHRKNIVANEKLEVDLYLPQERIAIEVDGISHREPVWGQHALEVAKRADNDKTGLCMANAIKLIRVQQHFKVLSNAKKVGIIDAVLSAIKSPEKYVEVPLH